MDIDIIFKIGGIGMITAVVSMVLKKSDRDDIATFVTLAGLVIVLVLVVDMISGLFETVKTMFGLY